MNRKKAKEIVVYGKNNKQKIRKYCIKLKQHFLNDRHREKDMLVAVAIVNGN